MSEPERAALPDALEGGDFRQLVTRMSFQALIGLGILENPLTRTRTRNLPGARLVHADLVMLRERTAGNLDEEEARHLDKAIADVGLALERIGSEAAS